MRGKGEVVDMLENMWDDHVIWTFRISREEIQMVEELGERFNLGASSTICLAIRELYKKYDRGDRDE